MVADQRDDEEIIFGELDRKRAHQSCCTCQSMALFFILIVIILASGLYYIYWQITREKVFSFQLPSAVSMQDFTARLDGLKPDTKNSLSLNLSNDEVTALFSEGLSLQSFILQDAQVQVMPSQMLIYGRLTKPLTSKVVLSAVPKVQEGKIVLETTGVTAGNFNFPKVVYPLVNQSITERFNSKLSLVYAKFTIEDVQLNENSLTIKGKAR